MKILKLFILVFSLCFSEKINATGGKSYILKPDAQGYLVVYNNNGTYKPGDTLLLSGYFKSVAIYNMSGNSSNYITITNIPGQTLIIGDSTWSGGAWAQALVFRGCHNIEVAGTSKNNFMIVGSNSTALDANGYPVKTAYFDLPISEMSDNFTVHDISIRHGGTGLWAKTEVSTTNSATWYPNTYLNNFKFYNLDIYDTYNEAMYIGHTATYWNIKTNTPYYPSPGTIIDTSTYKQPIKLTNVKIYNNYIHDIGNDGIQTAAIDNLEIFGNEVFNWATKKGYADNGGLLIGGRVKGFNVHDNYVHDSWGELVQVYAEGGGTSIISNNLLVRNKLDGVSIRGTNGLTVTLTNNTIAYIGYNAIRINGYYGGTGKNYIAKNIIAQPNMNYGVIYAKNYIYLENGGMVSEGVYPNDNKKYATVAEINLDENNYFTPKYNSTAIGYGYLKANKPPNANAGSDINITLPLNSVVLNGTNSVDSDGNIISYNWTEVSGPSQYTMDNSNISIVNLSNLVEGTYTFKLTVTDNLGATSTDTINIIVNPIPNQIPIADAGIDQSVIISIILDGSKSVDNDGSIVSYQWSEFSGPTATIVSPTSILTKVTDLQVGIYIFKLTITDNKGATNSKNVTVIVGN